METSVMDDNCGGCKSFVIDDDGNGICTQLSCSTGVSSYCGYFIHGENEYNKKLKEINEPKINIWDTNDNGTKKLSHKRLAEILIYKYNFITIGEEKHKILRYHNGQYLQDGEKFISSQVQELTSGKCKIHDVNEILGHIKRQTFKDRDVLNGAKPNLLNIKNGVLDLEDKKLLPHSPKYYFTYKIKWNYDAGKKCPKIQQFLSEVLRKEDLPTVQEFMGFCLFKKYFIKKAMIFVGERDTGKTTVIKLIVNLIGSENTSGLSLHKIVSDRFGVSNMFGKLLNFYDDLSFQDIKDTGAFKIATGGGYVSAEKKFGECFEFKNYAKLLFATNKISDVKDSDDEAYYSRWIIICFNNTFDKTNTKTDPNIVEKLTTDDEMSGLLNWALDGLQRLLKNNSFTYDKSPEENKLIMERSSNTVSAFAQDILIPEQGKWISKDDLYNIYSAYIHEFGGAKVTKEKFGRDISKKATYIVESRKDTLSKKSVRGWVNVGFLISEDSDNRNNTFLKLICRKNIITDLPKYIKESSFEKIVHISSKKGLLPLFQIYSDIFSKDNCISDNPINNEEAIE